MSTFKREINIAEDLNKKLDPTRLIERVMVFRTQNLLDLWLNEMSGQISDGKFENSRTEWLWEGATKYMLGERTEVFYRSSYIGNQRKIFPLNQEDISIFGERACIESGFESTEDLKRAWKEIADAIKNFKMMPKEMYIECRTKPQEIKKSSEDSYKERARKVLNDSEYLKPVNRNLSDIFSIKGDLIKNSSVVFAGDNHVEISIFRPNRTANTLLPPRGKYTILDLDKFESVLKLIIDFENKYTELGGC